MTPSTTDTTIPASPERAPSQGPAPAEGAQKPRRKRGGRRRHGSGGADGAAQSGVAQAQAPGRDTPAAGYAAGEARPAPAAPSARVERSGVGGESRRHKDDRPRRDDRAGKGRGDRERDHGRGRDRQGRGGQGVDETYTERKHVEQPAGPPPEVEIPAFAALGLEGKLLAGVAAMGYSEPTPIQEHAIPRVLAGRDVVGCAQTGTGKTAAFVLPILQRMSKPMVVDGKKAHPTALVVTPTRELCGQIEEVGETLATYSGRRVVAVFGGVPYDPQAKRVRKGVDLLVATPGRLLDMLRQGD
ncbi:MAG: DEAD/DEAH box helicase, partial [Deltaproteobacteria bacterium]